MNMENTVQKSKAAVYATPMLTVYGCVRGLTAGGSLGHAEFTHTDGNMPHPNCNFPTSPDPCDVRRK